MNIEKQNLNLSIKDGDTILELRTALEVTHMFLLISGPDISYYHILVLSIMEKMNITIMMTVVV